MSYLARLAAQASGAPVPPQALRPAPSFLRPAGARVPWAGELALEVDGPAPGTRLLAGAPLQPHAVAAPPTTPAEGGAPSQQSDAEIATPHGAAQTALSASAATPSEDAVIAISSLAEPEPAVAASATTAALAQGDATTPEHENDPGIAAAATPTSSESDPFASSPPEITLPAPTGATAVAISAISETAAAEPPTVTVIIDRIDVHAPRREEPSRPAEAPAPRPAPTLSLDAYLASRSGG